MSSHTLNLMIKRIGTKITVIALVDSRITANDLSKAGDASHLRKIIKESRTTHRKLVTKIEENATKRAFMKEGGASIVKSKNVKEIRES